MEYLCVNTVALTVLPRALPDDYAALRICNRHRRSFLVAGDLGVDGELIANCGRIDRRPAGLRHFADQVVAGQDACELIQASFGFEIDITALVDILAGGDSCRDNLTAPAVDQFDSPTVQAHLAAITHPVGIQVGELLPGNAREFGVTKILVNDGITAEERQRVCRRLRISLSPSGLENLAQFIIAGDNSRK